MSLLAAGDWMGWPLKVPSSPGHSVILWARGPGGRGARVQGTRWLLVVVVCLPKNMHIDLARG